MSESLNRLVKIALPAAVVGVALGVTLWVIFTGEGTGRPGGRVGQEFRYDISELKDLGADRVGYRQVDAIPAGVETPRAIAVGPDDVLYIAGDAELRSVNPDGETIRRFETGGQATCLAVADEGTVYVGMIDRVEVYGPDGDMLDEWEPFDERTMLTGLAVMGEDVFAADAGNAVVHRLDLSGNPIGRLGEADEQWDIPGLLVRALCLDIAAGADGLIRVTNPGRWRVETYTPDGGLELSWGEPSMRDIEGFCGCCNPTNVAVLSDGRVVTAEKGLPRVKLYDPHGRFLSVVALATEFDADTERLELAVDSRDRIHVLDAIKAEVRIFEPKQRSD